MFRVFSKKIQFKFVSVRFFSDSVRVRFAPSPTGFLHLGGLRTALYNFLFAKSKTGKFILRIEDTDQTRLVEGADEQLRIDLTWAGVEIDEGPNIGGNFGPYRQSERLHLYNNHVKVLLENGTAYHCFCTEKRLDLLRREAIKNREVPKYDNKCRHLTEKEINERLSKGDKPYLTTFKDLIYGNINYDICQQEGDPVIIKTDGYPTYHFANIVDDHLMKITHVLRGVEWQISTTKHLMMYRAFGWDPPIFGHLPLLLNSDGTKFSKRQNDIKISHYRGNGIFPLALLNFVVNAGGGFEKDLKQNVKPKIFTIQELARQFDITKLNTHSGKLMPETLLEFNNLELRRRIENKDDEAELIKEIQRILHQHFDSSQTNLQTDENHVRTVLHWSVNRIEKLSDLIGKELSFVWTLPKKHSDENLSFMTSLIDELEIQNEFSKDYLLKFLRKFAEKHGIKFNNLMKSLRFSLSGLKEGPGVAEMMEILGKNSTIHRLKMCLKK